MKHIPRFYVNTELYYGLLVSLNVEQKHHIFNVLRMTTKDNIRLFNQTSGEWHCDIIDIKNAKVKCVTKIREIANEDGPVIACSVIRRNKMSIMLEKITELGVSEIIPIVSEYTQNSSKYGSFDEKYSIKTVIQACEQSQRLSVPKLQQVTKIENFLQNYRYNCPLLVGDERPSDTRLFDVLEKKCVFLTGPEGGFSDVEHNLLDKYSFVKKFRMGCNILRSETAAIAFMAAWSCKYY